MSNRRPFSHDAPGSSEPDKTMNALQRKEAERYETTRLRMLDAQQQERARLDKARCELLARRSAEVASAYKPLHIQLDNLHERDARFVKSRANTAAGRAIFIARNFQRFSSHRLLTVREVNRMILSPKSLSGL